MTTTVQCQALEQEQLVKDSNVSLDSIKGQKVTMLIENSMGCIVVRHITLHEKTNVALGQSQWHKKPVILSLYYAMKGCRKVNGYKINQENSVVLAKGWQVPQGMTESSKGTFGFNAWECFDGARFLSAKTQLSDIVYCYGE